jgi:hyperosmotically inducible protein
MRHLRMIGHAVQAASLCMSTLAFGDAEYSSSQAVHAPRDAAAATERKSVHKADRLLAKNVRKALTQSNDVDLARMTVLAKSGKVTLSGSVPEEDEIQLAEQHAKEVAGVTTVANRLTIATPGH